MLNSCPYLTSACYQPHVTLHDPCFVVQIWYLWHPVWYACPLSVTHWVCNAKAQRLCSAGSSVMSHGRHLCSLSPSSKPSQQMWYSCFWEKNPSRRNSFSQSQICRHLLSRCEHREQADVCLKGAFFAAVTFIAGFFQSHNLADWRSFHSLWRVLFNSHPKQECSEAYIAFYMACLMRVLQKIVPCLHVW